MVNEDFIIVNWKLNFSEFIDLALVVLLTVVIQNMCVATTMVKEMQND